MLAHTLATWAEQAIDLWVFAYASLTRRPEGNVQEVRPAHVHGHPRALKMWSRVNRGTAQTPGLVFGLLPGGCFHCVVQRIAQADVHSYLLQLWRREMPGLPILGP